MPILGHHTVAEVRDLLKQYEWRIEQLNAATKKISAADYAANDLAVDWQAFLARWVKAKNEIKLHLAIVAGNPVADEVHPDEDDYQKILTTGSATYPSYTSKDLPGLQARIMVLVPDFQFSPMPANVSLDPDLGMYNAADASTKFIKEEANKAAQGTLSFMKANAPALILFSALGIGAVYAAGKIVLPLYFPGLRAPQFEERSSGMPKAYRRKKRG